MGRSVLRCEYAAANLVGRARLDERHGCDIPEPPARACNGHAREADSKNRGRARERQARAARRKRGDEDAPGIRPEDAAGDRRAEQTAASIEELSTQASQLQDLVDSLSNRG